MKVTADKKGNIELREVFSGVTLVTEDKEKLSICMRDTGFEFNYGGNWYSAKDGLVTKMMFSPAEQEGTTTKSQFSDEDFAHLKTTMYALASINDPIWKEAFMVYNEAHPKKKLNMRCRSCYHKVLLYLITNSK